MVNDAISTQHALPGRVGLTRLVRHGIGEVCNTVDLLLQFRSDSAQRIINVRYLLGQLSFSCRQAVVDRTRPIAVDQVDFLHQVLAELGF
ncbi:hypothetical protein A256_27823, partial [Pseudomonas syringae pv. actinidiae ICMP 19103]